MRRTARLCGLVLPALLAVALIHTPAGAAVAAAPSGRHQVVKPAPSPPADAWHPGSGPRIVAKPRHGTAQVRPLASPTVADLTVSVDTTWPTEYSTLVATTDADVGPTPYYLSIYDYDIGGYVAFCGTGTSCSASVTQPTAQSHAYIAELSAFPNAFPPPGEIAHSSVRGVTWRSIEVSLDADAHTVPVGGQATLTATTSKDVGPSPFDTEIYDLTTGTLLGECATGTSCSQTTSLAAAATDQFIAYVGDYGATAPPPSAQANSLTNFVTWSDGGMRVSLNVTRNDGVHQLLTATADQDVGVTAYDIELFYDNGQFLTECAGGTTCAYTTDLGNLERHGVVAFISPFDQSYPPADAQASSNTGFVVNANIFG